MRVHLGSDHAGYELKNAIATRLRELGHDPVDHGPATLDPADDYPPYVLRAAEAVANGPGSVGVVIGGSGNGEAMAANKVQRIRCALVHSEETARLAREHNDANVMSIGARMHDQDSAIAMVEAFVTTAFTKDERHQRRISMLTDYEATGALPTLPEA